MRASEYEDLQQFSNQINKQMHEVTNLVHTNPDILEIAARDFAYSCYRLLTGK